MKPSKNFLPPCMRYKQRQTTVPKVLFYWSVCAFLSSHGVMTTVQMMLVILGWTGRQHLIWVLQGVVHDGHQSQPGLSGSGDNLIGWQQEAIATSVPQLKGVGVLDALVVGPVHGATTGLVYDETDMEIIIIIIIIIISSHCHSLLKLLIDIFN